MDEIILKVKNISKCFSLNKAGIHNFKEVINNIFKKRDDRNELFYALNNVSLNLKKGEVLGIIGKNGAGKSTLLKILSGITYPDKGEIIFHGKSASILDIGAGFHPELSGRDNVFLAGQLYGLSKAEISGQFQNIADYSGIGNFINEPVKNYSAGMYLRLAFAVIAHIDADIFFFDEVLSVGDSEFQLKSQEKIRELKRAGKTVVIVSHNLVELSKFADRIIRFEKGQVLEEASIKKTLEKYLEETYLGNEKKSGSVIKPPYLIEGGIDTNEFIEVPEIRITAKGKTPEAEIVRTDEIEVTMMIQKKTADKLLAGIYISDMGGNRVISNLSYDSPGDLENKSYVGKAEFETTFPSHFLNAGLFKFSFVFIVFNGEDASAAKKYEANNALVIRIDQPKDREDIFNSLPGTMRPSLKWDFITGIE